ncbi:MAG TPA: hypothetical protein VG938_16390 [Verrucomicrobiae bacterium]|jgi:hypothetical protein|nr:hypothetical protein [Verrucomicrobiae bacterium]
MNFNFNESRNPQRRRLFIPVNAFSFSSFLVPIKFRQPAVASAGQASYLSLTELAQGASKEERRLAVGLTARTAPTTITTTEVYRRRLDGAAN